MGLVSIINYSVHFRRLCNHVLFVQQHSGPEVKWVDGGRPVFRVSTHLVSTIYTQVSEKDVIVTVFYLLVITRDHLSVHELTLCRGKNHFWEFQRI